jgi:arylsulfatase A-like enzyme
VLPVGRALFDRPSAIRTCCLLLCFTLLAVAACTSENGNSPSELGVERPADEPLSVAPPNILLIVTDDQFKGTMAAMPRTRFWFEEQGTRFTQTIVSSPLCCPSRASILSGRYVHNHGVLRNNLGYALDQRSTMQKYLRDEGYRTGIAGKLLQGIDETADPPYWDEWATSLWGYYNANFNVDGRFGPVEPYSVDFLRQRGKRFLRRAEENDDRPWFLYLAPVAPHLPYQPADRHVGAQVPRLRVTPPFTEEDRSDKPEFVSRSDYSLEEGKRQRAQMIRTLMSVDEMVDGIMKELGKLDERRTTLAFFLSDNGHSLGQHGLFAKRLPYRSAVEVPLLMRWPGQVAEGETSDRLVSTIDLLPTVLHAAGIEPLDRYPLDGRSLLTSWDRSHLLIEQYGNEIKDLPDWASLRSDSYQYTEYRRGGEVVFREYYDLTRDQWQLENLLGDSSTENDPDLEPLQGDLEEARACEGASCP